uniref:Uncharacterized protein n=1 Tax=Pseudonaja textilis TaxID=8673 RepID=A0A670XQB7_PSETE
MIRNSSQYVNVLTDFTASAIPFCCLSYVTKPNRNASKQAGSKYSRHQYGSTIIGQVIMNMICSNMRSIKDIPECHYLLPQLFWKLVEILSQEQVTLILGTELIEQGPSNLASLRLMDFNSQNS